MSVRYAARVLVVDESERLLLFRIELGDGDTSPLWIAPGGGIDAGEAPEAAVRRELREESGLDLPVARCVWTRRHVFTWEGREVDQRERFYFVRAAHAPVTYDGWHPAEHVYMREHRWWTAGEIATATAAATARFSPRRLAVLLPPLLAGDFPDEPLDTGV